MENKDSTEESARLPLDPTSASQCAISGFWGGDKQDRSSGCGTGPHTGHRLLDAGQAEVNRLSPEPPGRKNWNLDLSPGLLVTQPVLSASIAANPPTGTEVNSPLRHHSLCSAASRHS